MDKVALQAELAERYLYTGPLDGIIGPVSVKAIKDLMAAYRVLGYGTWGIDRLIVGAKQLIFNIEENGIAGSVDGLNGPQTQYAESVWDARRAGSSVEEIWRDNEDMGHVPKPTITSAVWPTEREVQKFFGRVGEFQARITLPYPLRLSWDLDHIVNTTLCHKKTIQSVQSVLEAVKEHYTMDGIKQLRLDLFGGCLNVRKKRGGSTWSMHSWGIAWDFDPDKNQLKWNHTRASFARPEYKFWHETWEQAGAMNLGRRKDYDWMHTQFARL